MHYKLALLIILFFFYPTQASQEKTPSATHSTALTQWLQTWHRPALRNVNAQDAIGNTALIIAADQIPRQIHEFLNENNDLDDDTDAFFRSFTEFYHYNETIIKHLLEHGARSDLHNKQGSYPLVIMTRHAKYYGVRLLIEHGVNCTTDSYAQALEIARKQNFTHIVNILSNYQGFCAKKDNEIRTFFSAPSRSLPEPLLTLIKEYAHEGMPVPAPQKKSAAKSENKNSKCVIS